jgi:adenylate kinase
LFIQKLNKNCSYLGTPGVGKSSLSRILCEKTGLIYIDVSQLAIEKGCLEDYDEIYDCPILDEDKVIYKRNFN